MLNVLEDPIRLTHEFPTEDENPENFETEPPQKEKYDDLFVEMKTELYPRCQTFSSLNFLAKLMHLKVLNKWTNRSFNMLLKFLKEAFPERCKLPDFHYATKKLLVELRLKYESIHVCKQN